jgi:hypothetical protein
MFGKLGRNASIISGLLGLGLAALIVVTNILYAVNCQQVIYQSLPAPGGGKDAVVFAMVCKDDTELHVQAKIAPVKGFLAFKSPDPFLQLTDVGDAAGAVKLRWLDDKTLRAAAVAQAKVYRQDAESDGVRIVYE